MKKKIKKQKFVGTATVELNGQPLIYVYILPPHLFTKGIAKKQKVLGEGVLVGDYDEKGQLIGIEIY